MPICIVFSRVFLVLENSSASLEKAFFDNKLVFFCSGFVFFFLGGGVGFWKVKVEVRWPEVPPHIT